MRRPHRKTRTGCLQCRQRRIKCGEEKPTCAHCVRYALSCKYEEPKQRATPKARSSPGASSTFGGPRSSREGSSSPSNAITQSLNATSSHPQQPWFHLEDLELLHLYTTSTYRSFSANRDVLWQSKVPVVATAHPFVMHGLLATSALHLATLCPERRESLRNTAASHEMQALPAFREAVSCINGSNGTAVFAFGAFVVAYASAVSSLAAESEALADDDILSSKGGEDGSLEMLPPRWLLLLRSAFSLFADSTPVLKVGLILPKDVPPTSFASNPDDYRLAALLPLIEPAASSPKRFNSYGATWSQARSSRSPPPHHPPFPPSRVPLSAKDAVGYRAALDALRLAMALPYNTPLNFHAAAYLWPSLVSRGFCDAIAQHRPEALVLFAHWCVLLRRGEPGANSWYTRGQARQIVAAAVRCLRSLGEEWVAWVEWPIACVFDGGETKRNVPKFPLDTAHVPRPWQKGLGLEDDMDVEDGFE